MRANSSATSQRETADSRTDRQDFLRVPAAGPTASTKNSSPSRKLGPSSRAGQLLRPLNGSRSSIADGLRAYPSASRDWMSEDTSTCRPEYQPASRRPELVARFTRPVMSTVTTHHCPGAPGRTLTSVMPCTAQQEHHAASLGAVAHNASEKLPSRISCSLSWHRHYSHIGSAVPFLAVGFQGPLYILAQIGSDPDSAVRLVIPQIHVRLRR